MEVPCLGCGISHWGQVGCRKILPRTTQNGSDSEGMFMKYLPICWSVCHDLWAGAGIEIRQSRAVFCHTTHRLSWSYQCCANALASGARFMGPVIEKFKKKTMIATVFTFWCVCVNHPLKRQSLGPCFRMCQMPKLMIPLALFWYSIKMIRCWGGLMSYIVVQMRQTNLGIYPQITNINWCCHAMSRTVTFLINICKQSTRDLMPLHHASGCYSGLSSWLSPGLSITM